jgi:hypothetical protein
MLGSSLGVVENGEFSPIKRSSFGELMPDASCLLPDSFGSPLTTDNGSQTTFSYYADRQLLFVMDCSEILAALHFSLKKVEKIFRQASFMHSSLKRQKSEETMKKAKIFTALVALIIGVSMTAAEIEVTGKLIKKEKEKDGKVTVKYEIETEKYGKVYLSDDKIAAIGAEKLAAMADKTVKVKLDAEEKETKKYLKVKSLLEISEVSEAK